MAPGSPTGKITSQGFHFYEPRYYITRPSPGYNDDMVAVEQQIRTQHTHTVYCSAEHKTCIPRLTYVFVTFTLECGHADSGG